MYIFIYLYVHVFVKCSYILSSQPEDLVKTFFKDTLK